MKKFFAFNQLHTVRGKGTILRTSLAKDVTPEKFRDAWDQVVDMSKAERMDSIIGATGSLDGLLCQLDGGKNASQAQSDSKEQDQFSFGNKHLILYALGGKFYLFCLNTMKLFPNFNFFTSIYLKSWCQCKKFNRFEIFV